MAAVTIRHTWDDGSSDEIRVEAGDGYPDGLGEARVQAVRMFAEIVGLQAEDAKPDDGS